MRERTYVREETQSAQPNGVATSGVDAASNSPRSEDPSTSSPDSPSESPRTLDTRLVLIRSLADRGSGFASDRAVDGTGKSVEEATVVEIPRRITGETPHSSLDQPDCSGLRRFDDGAFALALVFEISPPEEAAAANGETPSTRDVGRILREVDRIAERTLVVSLSRRLSPLPLPLPLPLSSPLPLPEAAESDSTVHRDPERIASLESQLADLRDEIADLHQRNRQLQSQAWRMETDLMTVQQINDELEAAIDGDGATRARALPRAPSITHGSALYGSPLNAPSRNHALEEAFRETSRHARALQQHIDNIESSRGWRAFSIYRRIKDSFIGRVKPRPIRQP
jgi:TolA-binding protein